MNPLIDSHCHIDFAQFDHDRGAILERCRKQGMRALVVPGATLEQWPALQSTVERFTDPAYPRLLPAYGLHPCFMDAHSSGDVDELDAWLHQGAVAVGEIGLDRFHDSSNLDRQLKLFKDQLSVARSHHLPILVHARKTQDLVLKLVKESGLQSGGIMHAFSGSLQQAQRAVDLGFKIGFGGAGTYDRANRIRAILRALPQHAIVFETDAPDIAPSFAMGDRNSPENLFRIVEILAEVRQEPVDQLWSYSSKNLQELLKITF